MKKVLSLVLVLTLVLGSFSAAFASVDFDDIAGEDCEDAVKTLAALGVVNGRSEGVFEPEGAITKAELAKMLVYVLGCEDLVSEGARSNFTDCVGHWAEPVIAFAAGQEIVNGDGYGKFQPDKVVSYDEAITMVVRALGYTDDSLRGTWPTMYLLKAKDLGITDDVKMTSAEADRGGVAMLVNNALDCCTVRVNKDGDIEKEEIGKDDEDDPIYRKLIDKVGDKENITVTPDTIDEDDKAYEETLIDLEPYMYETIVTYKNSDDEIVYVAGTKTKNIEGTYKGIEDGKVKVKVGDKTKKINERYVTPAAIYFNGAYDEDLTIGAIEIDSEIKLVFDSYKGNPDIDTECKGIVVYQSAQEVIFIHNEFDSDYPEDLDGIALPLTEDEDGDNIVDLDRLTIEGAAKSLEDIKEYDVINVYSSNDNIDEEPDYLRLVVTRESVEGKVAKVEKDDGAIVKAKIDGEYYDVDNSACSCTDLELGSEGTFFFDENECIVAWTGDSMSLNDYALLIGAINGEKGKKWADDETPQLKMFTDEGKTVIYDVRLKGENTSGVFDNVGFLTIQRSDEDADEEHIKETVKLGIDSNKIPSELKDSSGVVEFTLQNKMVPILVRYSVNSDDELTDIEIPSNIDKINDPAHTDLDDEMIGDTYDFTSSTVIFNANGDDENNYEYSVVDYDLVKENADDVYAVSKENSMGTLDAVLLINGASVSDPDNYAGIIKVEEGFNDSDERVYELTVLLDGKKQTLFTEDAQIENAVATTDKLVALNIDSDGVVTEIEPISDGHIYASGTVRGFDKDTNRVEITGTKSGIAKLSEDYAVYVYDKSDKELSLGKRTSIRNNTTAIAYDCDEENAGCEVILIIRN